MGSITKLFRRSTPKDAEAKAKAVAPAAAEKAPEIYVPRQGKSNGEPAPERRASAPSRR